MEAERLDAAKVRTILATGEMAADQITGDIGPLPTSAVAQLPSQPVTGLIKTAIADPTAAEPVRNPESAKRAEGRLVKAAVAMARAARLRALATAVLADRPQKPARRRQPDRPSRDT